MAENPIKTPLPADLPEDWTRRTDRGPHRGRGGLERAARLQLPHGAGQRRADAAKEIGEAFSGLATLGPDGKVPAGQLPDIGGFYEVEEAVPPASRKANTLYGLILADYAGGEG